MINKGNTLKRGVLQIIYDNEWFMNRIKEVRPKDYKEYKFLEEYKNAKTYIKALHTKCGNIVDILPNSFISRGSKCPICAKEETNKLNSFSHEHVQSELPVGVIMLDKYKGIYEPINFHCFFCDRTYKAVPRDMMENQDCRYCSGRYLKSVDEIKSEVTDLTDGEYSFIDNEYKNAHEKYKVKHNKCGNEYSVTMHNFRKGRRCRNCSASTGESKVASALNKLGIDYQREKTFDDLFYRNKLRIDFYIPSKRIAIEYNGIQHYEPVKHFGGLENLEVTKTRDKIKEDYCKNNDITLVVIPYTTSDIEEIKNIIKKYI